jgi:hypothetical protein
MIGFRAAAVGDSSGIIVMSVAPLAVARRDTYVGKVEASTAAPPDSATNEALPDSMRVRTEAVRRGIGRLTGVARDATSGQPLPGVNLSVEGTAAMATTNDRGEFTLSGLPFGTQTLLARKLGYVPDERPVDVVAFAPSHVEPSLTTMKRVLDTVRVVARKLYAADRNGFLMRQKTGMGHYFSAEQIEQFHPLNTSDLLWRVPGVRVEQGRFDKVARMRALYGGDCEPSIYVDGMRIPHFSASDLDNMVQPDYIEGVEVYNSAVQTPAQFMDPFSSCGAIIVWTRTSPPRPKP